VAPSKHGHYSHSTKSTFSAPSIFDKELNSKDEVEEMSSVAIQRRRLDSATSVKNSIATGAFRSQIRRIPTLPDKLGESDSFQCQLCQKLLGDIQSYSQWK